MFIGHHAVAFAAKRCAPKTSLGALMMAAMFLDLIWPIFLLTGTETMRLDPGNTAFTPYAFDSYPYSHSLATCCGWAFLVAGVYWAMTRRGIEAIIVGLAVLSHWVLDVVSHRPDMPIAPGLRTRVGLGLWNSIPATLVVEGALFCAGLWLYLRTTRARDRVGSYSLWAFVVFLLVMYAGSVLGPPAPRWQAVAGVSLSAWLLPLWAGWFDRHRTEVPE